MTTAALLTILRRRGVHLEPDGTALRYRALKGTLTDTDLDALRAHKPALLALLTDVAALEADGTAERLRDLWGSLSEAEHESLHAEAHAGDPLAGLILTAVSTISAPHAADSLAGSGTS